MSVPCPRPKITKPHWHRGFAAGALAIVGAIAVPGVASAAPSIVCSVNQTPVTTTGTIDAIFTGCGLQNNAGAAIDPYGDASDWIATDGLGNLFISETALDVVIKVDRVAGTATVVAGHLPTTPETDPIPGRDGDGGLATAATLAGPTGLAIDKQGDLFIADTGNQVVREVAPDGKISTLAGGGATSGGTAGDGGHANAAVLGQPMGLAVGGGKLFIADESRANVRAVDLTSGVISTVVGSATGADGATTPGNATSVLLTSPAGIAYGPTGILYVADRGENQIYAVSTGGTLSLLAGNGSSSISTSTTTLNGTSAVNAYFNDPLGLAVDSAGVVYVADSGDDLIRKVLTTGTIATVAGTPQTTQIPAAGIGNGGVATSARVSYPQGISIDPSGNLLVAGGEGQMAARQVNGAAAAAVAPANGGDPFPALPEAPHTVFLLGGAFALLGVGTMLGVGRRRVRLDHARRV